MYGHNTSHDQWEKLILGTIILLILKVLKFDIGWIYCSKIYKYVQSSSPDHLLSLESLVWFDVVKNLFTECSFVSQHI